MLTVEQIAHLDKSDLNANFKDIMGDIVTEYGDSDIQEVDSPDALEDGEE